MLASLVDRQLRASRGRGTLFGLANRSVVRSLACLPHHVISLGGDAEEDVAPLPLVARFGNTDERLLAICEEDGHLNVFRSGEECQKDLLTPVRRWTAHRDAIFDVCWSRDDRNIMSGSGDYRCCLWDTETMAPVSMFGGHSGSVKAVRFRDLNVFASAGRDGHIMIWDVRVANQRNEFGVLVKHPVAELRAAHSLRKQSNKRTPSRTPTNSHAASLTDVVNDSGGLGAARSVTSLAFSHDASVLLSAGSDGRVKYWDIRQLSWDTHLGRMSAESSSLISIDVRSPAVVGRDGELVEPLLSKRPHGITCIVMHPCGTKFAACSLDNHIYEYSFDEPNSDRCTVYNAPMTSFYAKACYSSNGLFIASGSSTVNVNIYDTNAARPPTSDTAAAAGGGVDPMHVLEGHTRDVYTVDWAPLDTQLVSCSDDGTARLWTVQVNRPKEKKRRTDSDGALQAAGGGETGPRGPPRIVQARLTQFFTRPPE